MSALWKFLDGKKTYIAAVGWLIVAIATYVSGDSAKAMEYFLIAASLIGLRQAIPAKQIFDNPSSKSKCRGRVSRLKFAPWLFGRCIAGNRGMKTFAKDLLCGIVVLFVVAVIVAIPLSVMQAWPATTMASLIGFVTLAVAWHVGRLVRELWTIWKEEG